MGRMPGWCTTRRTLCCTRGSLYPTGLHLFEARKFLDHRPDLARRIRECSRVEEVTAISGAESVRATGLGQRRPCHRDVTFFFWLFFFWRKFRQHRDLCMLPLNTYPDELVSTKLPPCLKEF